MSTNGRMIAVGLAVSNAKPLAFLQAALNGARDFGRWAEALGYETALITDEKQPLTIKRLATELSLVLNSSSSQVDRLILYFAGHGLVRDLDEGLWLLSDWHDELRAVAIEPLKRRLMRFNIRQLAIIADCCRSLPRDIEAADLVADAVLGRGPGQKFQFEIDRFIATQDGEESFAIPGADPERDLCIFSGVLLEGLWGLKRSAFCQYETDKVTSRSLGKFLRENVPLAAKRYGRSLSPSISPTFSQGADVYFREGLAVRPIVSWPSPPTESSQLHRPPNSDGTPEIDAPAGSRSAIDALSSDDTRRRLQRDQFRTGSGMWIAGAGVQRLWAPSEVRVASDRHSSRWHFRNADRSVLSESIPLLVELDSGLCVTAAAVPNFVATIQCEDRGASSLVLTALDGENLGIASAGILDRLDVSPLRAEEVTDIATKLRMSKHYDLVLGVMAAYLYDSIGDVDSIRRMAFFYSSHAQPIPYDVALLARVGVHLSGSRLLATIPTVSARAPRSSSEIELPWTCQATTETQCEIVGRWPWMRQGWLFLSDADDSSLVRPGLFELVSELTTARIATLTRAGGMELAKLFGLTPRDPDHHDPGDDSSDGSPLTVLRSLPLRLGQLAQQQQSMDNSGTSKTQEERYSSGAGD